MCTAMSQCLEPRSAENVFEVLVHETSIGYGCLALQRLQLLLFSLIVGGFDLILEQLIDKRIDTADEEAGDRSDMADVLARGITLFQGSDVGLGHLAIIVDREDQRDVDMS